MHGLAWRQEHRPVSATDWFTRLMAKLGWCRPYMGSMSASVGPGVAVGGSAPTVPTGRPLQVTEERRIPELGRDPTGTIDRPLSPDAAAALFVHWCQETGLTGERLWRDLWQLYVEWHCHEQGIVSLPDRMSAQFAQALSRHCRKGQIRLYENGRLRRLTTYEVDDNLSERLGEPITLPRAA